jgi:hypothetical protein
MGEFDHIVSAMNASPIMRELVEMGSTGDFSRLDANQAKRHHYIPQFVLREFATRRDGKHFIFQMPTQGRRAPTAVSVRDAALRKNLYRAIDENGKATNRHEGYLELIERHAAHAIRRLLQAPESLAPGDRATIAFFVAFQMMRTLAAAELVTEAANVAFRAAAPAAFGDRRTFAARRRAQGHQGSDDEIEQLRQDMLEQVREGKVTVAGANGADFASGFQHAAESIPPIISFDWLLLRASAGGFIASDRGYAIHDPAPPFPWAAQGLCSSDYSETFVPLADTAGLVIRPATLSCSLDVREVSGSEIEGLNLRTFGWATGYVYAKSQKLLDEIRVAARRQPGKVIKPKTLTAVIAIEVDPDDSSLADANRARGWPARIRGRDSRPRDYVVISNDGPRPEEHRRVAEIGERRLRKRLGIGPDAPLDGHFVTELRDPLDFEVWPD